MTAQTVDISRPGLVGEIRAHRWGPVLAMLGAMVLAAGIVAAAARINPAALFFPYFYISFGITLLAILAFLFVEIARLAPKRADHPIRTVWSRIAKRRALLALPLVAFPMFMVGFTTTKTGIPFLVGYEWDVFWADADRLIFGRDVWQFGLMLHPSAMQWMQKTYVWWGLITYGSVAMITLYGSPRTVFTFFTATFATWFLGGCLMAYAFSAAGPAFAHIFTADLQARFAPLHDFLSQSLDEAGPIRFTQQYLLAARFDHDAVKGGGISAMPSMHVGMAALLLLAAWRTKWLIPAGIFWLTIFIASGLTGYHYWVDGIFATAIAVASWLAADAAHSFKPSPSS